jgi:hypothetical protein
LPRLEASLSPNKNKIEMAFDPSDFISSLVLAMKITKKHKAYAVVLGLGLAVLGLDRGLARPETADAAPVLAEAVNNQAASGLIAGNHAANAFNADFAVRLQSQAQQDGLSFGNGNNPFVPSTAWIASRQQSLMTRTPVFSADFKKSHILSGIIQSKNGGQAIIDGQIFVPGQIVDGVKVVAIGLDSVRMSDGTGQFDLVMPAASGVTAIAAN